MTALLKPFLDDALHGGFAKPETTQVLQIKTVAST
jgi:hypothetical protein